MQGYLRVVRVVMGQAKERDARGSLARACCLLEDPCSWFSPTPRIRSVGLDGGDVLDSVVVYEFCTSSFGLSLLSLPRCIEQHSSHMRSSLLRGGSLGSCPADFLFFFTAAHDAPDGNDTVCSAHRCAFVQVQNHDVVSSSRRCLIG